VSRRARAVAMLLAALACAAAAAAIAGDYGANVADRFGELRPVLVASQPLPRRTAIRPRDAARHLVVRRVPAHFVPPNALSSTAEAIGRAPAAAIPAGSYVLASQLEEPRQKGPERSRIGPGRRPVEIEVTGAAALAATGRSPEGARVDVVVTTEPDTGGRGRTFVAAEGVELLALTEGGTDEAGDPLPGPEAWTATLALTRSQALRLIQAENFSRQVRLLPRS
jgi:Flp pilus assembly protein CpaB